MRLEFAKRKVNSKRYSRLMQFIKIYYRFFFELERNRVAILRAIEASKLANYDELVKYWLYSTEKLLSVTFFMDSVGGGLEIEVLFLKAVVWLSSLPWILSRKSAFWVTRFPSYFCDCVPDFEPWTVKFRRKTQSCRYWTWG